MRVDLLLAPGCPNAAAARAVLAQALDELEGAPVVTERVGDYPSPTVLVDSVDVMNGAAGTPSGRACRLDLPTLPRLMTALRQSTEERRRHST